MWQPIGTAPKDGTPVDLWCRVRNGRPVRLTNMWFTPSTGWRTDKRNEWKEQIAKDATHWMPLPPPPSE